MKNRMKRLFVSVVSAMLLVSPCLVRGQGAAQGGSASGGTPSRFAKARAAVEEEKALSKAFDEMEKIKAKEAAKQAEAARLLAELKKLEAKEQAFLDKVKAGDAKRFDFGEGVVLDLVKVGHGENAFFMGCFEVTQKQYQLVTGKRPSSYREADWAKHPVGNVSWQEANEFCQVMTKAFEEERGDYVFTLPTEQQWEQAATAGEDSEFAGGDKLDEVGWYRGNSNGHTHPVGMKKPNALGIYDMSGNAWEWCLDSFDKYRVIRGGSYRNDYTRCRARFSSGLDPESGDGFRVALCRQTVQ